jgi:Domain of Unknown Function (DUF349)
MSDDNTPAPHPTPASMPKAAPKPGPMPGHLPGHTAGAGPRPGPPPRTGVPTPPHGVATVHTATATASEEAKRFGRVAEDGTVYVRTADGERAVGSYPGATPDEALAYFGRKYDEVLAQVELFEQRLSSADVSASEATSGIATLRQAAQDLNAVGDLAALDARIEALVPVVEQRRAEADAARARARDEARTRRVALVEEAESLAAVPAERTQWRADGQRMKDLFEQWRAEQRGPTRLDRRSEDELWKRFSHARTAFDRKRRQHFAHLDQQQEEAKAAKTALVAQAEALQSSTDWGATAATYKRLMDQWRAAGRASRKDDDELWSRFRAAQDAFFAARHAVQAEQDAEFAANLTVKEALLAEAEALLPVTDLAAAKAALRSIQDRWEAAGKVPRADIDRVERRMRAVEQAVRDRDDERWQRTNPEARARAQSAVDQLQAGIADLTADIERARARGDQRRLHDLETALATRREWLEQAQRALSDFGG